MNLTMREFSVGVSQHKYPKNIIRNQRYTWYGFPFKVLGSQFKLFFNKYFFCVCMTQLFSRYSVSPLISNIMPWVIVLSVTLFREGIDDVNRYKLDKKVNSEIYSVIRKFDAKIQASGDPSITSNCQLLGNKGLSEGSICDDGSEKYIHSTETPVVFKNILEMKKCSELCVGDIILLSKNMRVPADCILLAASEPNVFLRTDQLDGETDWKLRIPALPEFCGDSLLEQDLKIVADLPHKDIYSFVGQLIEGPDQMYPLSLENTLWMNTVLASGRALCCVIYTGTDTRATMNTLRPKIKIGLIDRELNVYAFFLCALSVCAAIAFTIMRGASFRGFDTTAIRFIVIFSSVIPISLKVSIDWARYLYTYFIQKDIECQVRNSTIPEELGRIGYLLTDKTGTLTCNVMKMKKVHIGTVCFSFESDLDVINLLKRHLLYNEESNNRPEPEIMHNDNRDSGSLQDGSNNLPLSHRSANWRKKRNLSQKVYDLLVGLSVCHNVTPINEDGERTYQASSPDEVAIVSWTDSVGMRLVQRDSETIVLEDFLGLRKFKTLHIFPFTSESKRMGIIVEDDQGKIDFYMKGADVVMKNIVQVNDWLAEETDNMAREGLRTLVIGKKRLQPCEYKEFCKIYSEASCSMTNRVENIKKAMEFIEKDLSIIGLTGVEDRLQDGVMVTLECMRNAGIRIWMLTGDKVETATCIAISSRLFSKTATYKTIENCTRPEDAANYLNELIPSGNNTNVMNRWTYLVIDGVSIQTFMDLDSHRFIEMTSRLDSIVCCRCSPTQKADITAALKKFTKERVACIGDGGNDVSMITEAHVGIGIVGKEGMQASLASDYSLLKFSDVCDLFLWHGRNSYQGTARLAYLIIHRGTIISVMQGIFCSLLKFAPFTLYQGTIIVLYVTCYTLLPFFASILSYDIVKETAFKFPELYKEMNKKRALNLRSFATWNVVSFYQGALIILFSLHLFKKELNSIMVITFSSLIINELLMVAFAVENVTRYLTAAIIASLFFYIISFLFLEHELILPCPLKTFIPKLLLINTCAIIFTLVQMIWNRFIKPSSAQKLSNN